MLHTTSVQEVKKKYTGFVKSLDSRLILVLSTYWLLLLYIQDEFDRIRLAILFAISDFVF